MTSNQTHFSYLAMSEKYPAPQHVRGDIIMLIKIALAEDIGSGDMTSQLLIAEDAQAHLAFVARQEMVLCGVDVPTLVYAELDARVSVIKKAEEGARLRSGDVIAVVSGPARAILSGERTALNIMQRMSGVATLTRQYVDAISATHAKILDTRKTMPGMRHIDKYAVRIGGGVNHRMGLYDAVLVKDNHVGMRTGVLALSEIVKNTRNALAALLPPNVASLPIIVECDTLAQLADVLDAKPDRIMLDNMSLEMLREAVNMTAGRVPLEATGGVNLRNVHAIAEVGVDYISVGAITHSAPAVDIGLDVIQSQ